MPETSPQNLSQSNSMAIYDNDLDPFSPPKLYYALQTRKKKIARFWIPLLIDCCIIPVALFYSLRFSTQLSDSTVFAITTAMIGGTLIMEFFLRGWHLWKANSTCGVKGAPRTYFDWTHWTFLIAILVVVAELIVGNSFPEPIVRLLAMPVPSAVLIFALDVLVQDICYFANLKTPVRISTVPKGAPFRPGIYSIIEDIVSTDGGGERMFRDSLDIRYSNSYMFRRMLCILSLFWSFSGLSVALGTSALVWTLDKNIAYGIGWVAPYVWAVIWALLTIHWVKKFLVLEQASWAEARRPVTS